MNIQEKTKRKESKKNIIRKKQYALASFLAVFSILSVLFLNIVKINVEAKNESDELDKALKTVAQETVGNNQKDLEKLNKQIEEVNQIEESSLKEPQISNPQPVENFNEISTLSQEEAEESSNFPYNENILLPKEHQEYLYELCMEYGLDYYKTLAVIQHESVYDPNIISSTNDYGYFQINIVNHDRLSEATNTPKDPLDPYVNIQWGTYMLDELYDYWSERGISGDQLDTYVWSSYNKGITGFRKYGEATTYVNKVRTALEEVKEAFSEAS